MQRPPLLEPNEFCLWKSRFETYVKSKYIDLWQVIEDGDFYFEVEDSEMKLMKETPYELHQTSDDSDSQDESNEDVDEEEAEAFNLLARNFSKGNRFGRVNRFGNSANKFGRGRGNSFGNKGGESSKPKGACYNYGIEGHFASECKKPKEKNAFIGGA
ncbi:UBN2 domain-containing protein [Tanacetum coccineum]